MRLVIDMQGAQSTGSRDRGIGRYTHALVKGLIRQLSTATWSIDQIVLAFNGAYADTIGALRADLAPAQDDSRVAIWYPAGFESYLRQTEPTESLAAKMAYESFLLSLNPDIILVTSLFEGAVDPTVTSIHRYQQKAPVACVLYDLIPYTNPSPYLDNPAIRAWYTEKLDDLKRADLLLSISEYSRTEAITELAFDADRVVNISTAVDDDFRAGELSGVNGRDVRERYGLTGDFVMYTGGADHRKNIDGLVKAFAALPADISHTIQLAIVCSLPDALCAQLQTLAKQLNLPRQALVMTGYVPDEDLKSLYRECRLFVFPSFQEGFGLPALEAIQCGAAVLGSNRSSIPEVLGCDDALFDPSNTDAMAALIKRGLTDDVFRQRIQTEQATHAQRFSWDATAKRALKAICDHLERVQKPAGVSHKLKLAFISPLPPARSGIADYSATLLPRLSTYYDIEVIVEQPHDVTDSWVLNNLHVRSFDWLAENFDRFDRVLYQFGNSTFHWHMFDWLAKLPGVVVLHDFFLSGVLADHELHHYDELRWTRALYDSHGYPAVLARFNEPDITKTIWHYPANLPVLQHAQGVVVHTEHAKALGQQWYGRDATRAWEIVPLVRESVQSAADDSGARAQAKRVLGYQPDDFLVCSFGQIGVTKLTTEIINAWQRSVLASRPDAFLVLVGQPNSDAWDSPSLPAGVKITGWVDPAQYALFLQAADMAIQLRTHSRGETSAAALDCLNYGVATIINAHGSLAELDRQAVHMIADPVDENHLVQAIDLLAQDPMLRQQYSGHARELIHRLHTPQACAKALHQAIERVYNDNERPLADLCRDIGRLALPPASLKRIASGLARSFPPAPRTSRCLIDLTHWLGTEPMSAIDTRLAARLKTEFEYWQNALPSSWRLEFVYTDYVLDQFRYAQRFISQCLGIPDHWATDDVVTPLPGDTFICDERGLAHLQKQRGFWPDWGNEVQGRWLVLAPDSLLMDISSYQSKNLMAYIGEVFTKVICQDQAQLDELRLLRSQSPPRFTPALELAIGLPT